MALDVVLSGGGTHAIEELGAFAAVQARYDIEAVIGTSAGSIVAAAYGAKMHPTRTLQIMQEAFSGGVLDPSLRALPRFGAHLGDKIHALLKKHFPMPLGDLQREARIVVCSLDSRRAELLTRKTHPDVILADAVRASISIPGFFAATRLRAKDPALYVDGGTANNFAMDCADDLPGRTIGIRTRGTHPETAIPVRPWDVAGYAKALAALLMRSSDEAHDSQKSDAKILTIKTDTDGLDFTIDAQTVRERYLVGYKQAILAIASGELGAS